MDDTFSVFFYGATGGRFNLETKEMSDTIIGITQMLLAGDADGLKRTYRIWIPGQDLSVSRAMFSFMQTTPGNSFFTKDELVNLPMLVAGKVCRLRTTLYPPYIEDPIYQLYDAYPRNGTPIGMVIKTSIDGRNGLAISLKDVGIAPWSTQFVSTGATDIHDGISNTIKIQALENWETDYPAFSLCASLGEGWYLPSIEEAYPFIRETVDELNYYLEAIDGGEVIDVRANYLTSTEAEWNTVRRIYVWEGISTPIFKGDANKIRAFYRF